MSQGWSNISISIKSDMLAKLLRDHGITPKGAGNVKNGAIYDLQGRRLQSANAGKIYIQDGVKKINRW